jgi:hypothetical protein
MMPTRTPAPISAAGGVAHESLITAMMLAFSFLVAIFYF